MQLIWIASPTSKIKKLNITRKQLKRLTLIFSLLFMGAGSAFYFIGFRVAIRIKPAIAQSLGGVVTIDEQREIEEQYRNKLDKLQSHINEVEHLVEILQDEKVRLAKIATPSTIAGKLNNATGSGGPLLMPINSTKKNNLFDDLDKTIELENDFESSIASLERQWRSEIDLLQQIPTNAPIDVPAHSNYGNRIDPISGKFSFHSGIDFPAPPGTNVMAAGDGKVLKVSSDSGYGLFIEIKHALGTMSKYGHLSKSLVQEGDIIHRGQIIGKVGSTGRSTGPHLHYEVIEDGNFKNPNEFIVSGRRQNLNQTSNLD